MVQNWGKCIFAHNCPTIEDFTSLHVIAILIHRDGYTATGFVVRYDSVVFLVTSIHSFFEGDEVHSNSNKAYKLLLPDGLKLSETMRSRILETYSFKFCSGTKHGQDVLHNSEGVPNLFANTVSNMCTMRMPIQWTLSIMDTLGTKKQFIVQRFTLFRGYLKCTAIYLDPPKLSVIERFSLLGEFVKRGFTVYQYNIIVELFI